MVLTVRRWCCPACRWCCAASRWCCAACWCCGTKQLKSQSAKEGVMHACINSPGGGAIVASPHLTPASRLLCPLICESIVNQLFMPCQQSRYQGRRGSLEPVSASSVFKAEFKDTVVQKINVETTGCLEKANR